MATFQQFRVTPQGGQQRRRKVKTGCGTCRTRKVKCDEAKPSCQKCLSTGRSCDGYASLFRFHGGDASVATPSPAKAKTAHTAPKHVSSDVSLDEVASLQRCFSIKTLFEYVSLGCNDEARQVLRASLTDPAIRHAVSSLRALRDDLETSCPVMPPAAASTASSISSAISSAASSPQAYSPACMSSSVLSYESLSSSSPAYGYGLQQYCLALGGLASHLSSIDASLRIGSGPPDIKGIRSALLCCQVFISIEQVRSNYAAMAQHIIQGLRILYEHRERLQQQPVRTTAGDKDDQTLPALDVFVIKLFAAPCKFADAPQPGTVDSDALSVSTEGSASEATSRMRVIVPDMRTGLTRLSASTLSYLANVSLARPGDSAAYEKLMVERRSLLASLNLWLTNLERQQLAKGPRLELLSVSFLRFFHRILRVVLLSTEPGGGMDTTAQRLAPEYTEFQSIASSLGERVKTYGAAHAHGPDSSGGKRNWRSAVAPFPFGTVERAGQ